MYEESLSLYLQKTDKTNNSINDKISSVTSYSLKDSILQGCYAVPKGTELTCLRRDILLPNSRSSSPKILGLPDPVGLQPVDTAHTQYRGSGHCCS